MAHLEDVLAPPNEEGTKATILKWCKAAGDRVLKDEPLLELETDKVTVEIPSPATGRVAEILKEVQEEVLPGNLLARIRTEAEDRASATPADGPGSAGTASASAMADAADAAGAGVGAAGAAEAAVSEADDARALLSPAVRRLLSDHALSVEDIAGSGRGGRITAQDVARRLGAERGVAERGVAEPGVAEPASSVHVAHTPVRRRVAEHMARSLAASPHVTTLFEADLTRVQAHRSRHAAEYERQGTRLTLTAYFIAACARALAANPAVNATYHEDGLELHADANIGVGTALGNEGLIVPVIHAAQNLGLPEIARKLGLLVSAARAGRLTPRDVRGGTFTLSNHGVGGSLLAAPIIINQPQVAILGIGKVERRVCVLEPGGAERIGIRTMCYLTLTIDHRALDAFQANAFLAQVVASLEKWSDG